MAEPFGKAIKRLKVVQLQNGHEPVKREKGTRLRGKHQKVSKKT